MQHNKKHQVPRYAPFSPHGISRAPFLDGRIKVCMGPEQDLWSMPEQWVYPPDVGPIGLQPYVPPGDWAKEGSLLHVPQVVHLSPLGQIAGQPDFETEDLRLIALFRQVVDVLKQRRPGRTWGKSIDWFTFNNTPVFGSYFTADHWIHMIAPQAGTPRFFGPNYLHIYAGYQYFAYFENPGDVTSQNFSNDNTPGFNAVGTLRYNASKAKVTTNYDSFAGYATRIFGAEPFFDPNEEAFIHESVADLKDFGFTYDGKTQDLTDVEKVMKVIGDHFHFDSVTGKDSG